VTGANVCPTFEDEMTEFESMPLNDFSKLRIEDGRIHYRLYQQDGTMQDMDCADTLSNRLFVSWVQKIDRYTVSDGL
jgi:hypothetical protein